MLKKILLGTLIVIVLLMVGGFFWVRSVLAGDAVRVAIANQISKAIGQPVTIGRIGATAYPRVTVNLGDVRIGEGGQVSLGDLHIGTDFRALLSRRIEHATLRLTSARIELPLPPFPGLTEGSKSSEPSGPSPVELVSIDEVVLTDVQIVSGGRTLRGDIELVPHLPAVEIRKFALGADKSAINATGRISDIAGPVGDITLKASTLDFDALMAFANDFSKGFGTEAPAARRTSPAAARGATPAAPPAAMNIAITLTADRATMGGLVLDKLSGKARITPRAVTLDPTSFGVFGGKYEGALTMTLGAVPNVTARARLTGIDVAAATAFAGSPNTMSGRLSGQLDFAGRGADAAALTNTGRGTLRVDVTDGVVKNLGLINAFVVATSMREGALQNVNTSSKDEPFSAIGATLNLANGAATTNDFSFVSKNLNLSGQGAMQLSAATVDLKARMQLSDELSKQAGADLVRYTQEQGRVTLPATISGPASAPSVRLDLGDMAKRALRNAATEEVQQRLKDEAAKKLADKVPANVADKLSNLLKR